ncbi:MAG: sulfite oxidase [Myxococcales bacterium]|nr:sulfite oxidase [Myxococcales bacterium]
MGTTFRGIWELYDDDPEAADAKIWGRRSEPISRRGFLAGSGRAALAAALGGSIAFSEWMPGGVIPAAFAATHKSFKIPGKEPGLVVLNDRPLNAETPAHLLDDDVTPASRLFVRNNGLPPEAIDVASWTLRIEGEATREQKEFSIARLKKEFRHHTYRLQLECAGNGRSEFVPPARGNQWTTGAVGCPEWTGVRLRELLEASGVTSEAVYVAYYGADRHISGEPGKIPISRGVPIAKALQDETLVAWAMNGADIPLLHGHPLRLVCGGFPGSTSGKWLRRIVVRDRVHDGPKMGGKSYRVPCRPVAPGSEVSDADMCIIDSMPVKSLITFPKSGLVHPIGEPLALRGHAWAGERAVARVDVSTDYGKTWQRSKLAKPPNRLAWQRWQAEVRFPSQGYYEVWVRATDSAGREQPMIVPGWNPKGYLNNATHRISARVMK